jgi:hypothetical protein
MNSHSSPCKKEENGTVSERTVSINFEDFKYVVGIPFRGKATLPHLR